MKMVGEGVQSMTSRVPRILLVEGSQNLDVILSKLDTWRWRGLLFCISFPFPPTCTIPRAYQVALVVKNLPANAGEIRDAGWIFGSGRTPGGGYGNPLQYSYLENPMDRGA